MTLDMFAELVVPTVYGLIVGVLLSMTVARRKNGLLLQVLSALATGIIYFFAVRALLVAADAYVVFPLMLGALLAFMSAMLPSIGRHLRGRKS